MYICKRSIVIGDVGHAPNEPLRVQLSDSQIATLLEEGWLMEVSATFGAGTLSVKGTTEEVAPESDEPEEIAALDPERKPRRKR